MYTLEPVEDKKLEFYANEHILSVYADTEGYAIVITQIKFENNQILKTVIDEMSATKISYKESLKNILEFSKKYNIVLAQVNAEYDLRRIAENNHVYFPFDIKPRTLNAQMGLIEIAALGNDGLLKIKPTGLRAEVVIQLDAR